MVCHKGIKNRFPFFIKNKEHISTEKMTEPIDCPICFDTIDGLKNCVTTECGHKFHTNCLMKNISCNGFACPCCRSQMAEEEESDDDDDETTGTSVVSDDEIEETSAIIHDEYPLRGFRFMLNRVEGIEIEASDIEEENQMIYGDSIIPTIETMTAMLEERGITMFQLVAAIMSDHEEYLDWDETGLQADSLWGIMRNIITNFPGSRAYKPSQEELDEVRVNLDQAMDQVD